MVNSENEEMKIEPLSKKENTLFVQQSIQIKGEADYFQKYKNETACSNEFYKASQKLQRNSPVKPNRFLFKFLLKLKICFH
jgi:hypothetical protein